VKAVDPEKVILFGSNATGRWVEHRYTEGGITFEYISDYDILLITKSGESRKDYEVQEHGDVSPMAATMTFGRQKPDCIGNCWVPDVPNTPVSNKLAPTLLQRIENPVDRKYLKYEQGATPPSGH